MNTKLVYVLTCAPEATYIEQALMAVFSARHWNPAAHIVLIVDDLTDTLFVGKRAEILDYITEKIVIPFDDATLSPMYRSRWIKTSVRRLITGDFLFIDCDTICCADLSDVDDFQFEIGAVGDNNTSFQNDLFKNDTIKQVSPLCDISNEEYYFSSGVMFCKDTSSVYKLYDLWHKYWELGLKENINIDQPSLAKANIELEHIIDLIDDKYNCVLYTQTSKLPNAVILHISNFPQTSFLFKYNVLKIIRESGLKPWVKELILQIHTTYLPFDYHIRNSSLKQRFRWIEMNSFSAKIYHNNVNNKFSDWCFRVSIEPIVKLALNMRFYKLGLSLWMIWKRLSLLKKNYLRSNICSSK
ncbi:MAG: hypothetical protein IJ650_04075 [Paludibacteraceae bacterium]|nr:hypothetical protein [Paludibacteraceae bacterium]